MNVHEVVVGRLNSKTYRPFDVASWRVLPTGKVRHGRGVVSGAPTVTLEGCPEESSAGSVTSSPFVVEHVTSGQVKAVPKE